MTPSTCRVPAETGPFLPLIPPRLRKPLVHPGGVIDPTTISVLRKLKPDDPRVIHLKSLTPLDYKPLVISKVNVLPYGAGDGHKQFIGDGEMAYKSAIAYLVTGVEAYATQVVRILDAWASTCVSFEGSNAPLEAAWGTAAMARAAELLKYIWPLGWKNSGVEKRYLAWVDALILTHLVKPLGWDDRNNWGLSICEARLMLAILREGTVTPKYDWSKEFMWAQSQYQRIHSGYVFASGQHGETTRDLYHAQFSIGSLVQIPEILLHQGIDLYGFRDSLMHRCIEFHAQILLGGRPASLVGDVKDIWYLPCGWRMAYKYYNKRKGLSMPFTEKLLAKNTNDAMTFHWGLGSITHGV